MIRQLCVLGLGFSAYLLLSGCSEPLTTSSDCTSVAVTVTAGAQPTFSWRPSCQIEGLTVARAPQGAVVWSTISVNLTNRIAAPVRYGVFPSGAALTANRFEPLAPGTRYQVTLFRAADGQGDPVRAVGTAVFVP